MLYLSQGSAILALLYNTCKSVTVINFWWEIWQSISMYVYSISAAISVLRIYTKKIIQNTCKTIYIVYTSVYVYIHTYTHTYVCIYIHVHTINYTNIHYCVSSNSKYIIIYSYNEILCHHLNLLYRFNLYMFERSLNV